MSPLEIVLLLAGLALGIVAALPQTGVERVWYRAFGHGEVSEISVGLVRMALLFAVTIGGLALAGEIAG